MPRRKISVHILPKKWSSIYIKLHVFLSFIQVVASKQYMYTRKGSVSMTDPALVCRNTKIIVLKCRIMLE
jgi:hypothetical protein